jgi:hypothetical protein
VSFFFIFDNLKPKPTFHDSFDKIAVVSWSNKYFEAILILSNVKFSIDFVCEVDHKQKLFKFVDLGIYAVV